MEGPIISCCWTDNMQKGGTYSVILKDNKHCDRGAASCGCSRGNVSKAKDIQSFGGIKNIVMEQ